MMIVTDCYGDGFVMMIVTDCYGDGGCDDDSDRLLW